VCSSDLDKIARYRIAERKLRYHDREPRSVLFIVPGQGRLETLRRVAAPGRKDDHHPSLSRWPILATTTPTLRRDGPLAHIWQPIDLPGEPPRAPTELPARSDLSATDPWLALGRRWGHDQPDFWERLSPLARPLTADAGVERVTDRDLRSSAINGSMDDREDDVEEEPWR
jgi:hypothetical protein